MVKKMNRDILENLCKSRKITISALEKALNMSNGSLKKGGDIKSERLLQIAEFFDVSMEFLMGVDEIKKAPAPDVSALEQIKVISLYSQLNESEKEIILSTMKKFVESHK